MYKIEYGKKFHISLERFISGYSNSFTSLYKDSGLIDEESIINYFINISLEFEQDIYSEIEKILQEEIVAHKFQNNQKSIKIFIKSFMLEIFYEEDNEKQIRFIEDIIINKK